MSALSSRYAGITLAVLMVALVPTVITGYLRATVVERPPLRDALPDVLDGRPSAPTSRRASTIRREFDSEDWVEREYTRFGEAPITMLAVRAYDMKRLYHHPELAVTEANYDPARLVTVASPSGPLHVHMLSADDGRSRLAGYVLLYRGRSIGNPLLFQFSVAPELLLTGRRPLTLLFAEAHGPVQETTEAAVQRLLAASVASLAASASTKP
ncbi:MAG TPA: hypothetical protein VMF13_20345 [Luteitalea sp.]|nr:hypothetical protein [Luteitalea sp.]